MFGLGIWELIIVLVIIGLPILIIKLLNIHRNKPYKMEEVPIYDHTSLGKLYFSFNGRIPRSTFWLKYQLPMLVITIIAFIIANPTSKDDIYAVVGFVTLLTIYPSIVVNVKRAHDRDRPWWFIIFYLIPFINIWIAIELLFLKGTTGINRYGRDPLELSTNIAKYNLGMLKKLALVFTFIISLISSIGGIANIITSQTTCTGCWIIFIIISVTILG